MADRYLWTSADGEVVDLSDFGAGFVHTGEGTTGMWSPQYEMVAAQFSGVDGSTVQAIKVPPSTPTLGLFIQAEDKQAFRERARWLRHAMRPRLGMGTLSVSTEWGDTRNLDCYCSGGFAGDAARGVSGATYWRMLLEFYAPDPWWYGDVRDIDVGLGAPVPFFGAQGFPLTLSSTTVQGQFLVDMSDADTESYPVWTITGPGSSLTLRNETTGLELVLNATIGAGELVTIDHRPGQQSIRRGASPDGQSLLAQLGSGPAFWPLVEGVNTITAALTGSSAASRIQGVYTPRYAGI